MSITSPIFSLFARSPFGPLQEHMTKAQACCDKLLTFFEAVYETRWDDAVSIQLQIARYEDEADELKKKLKLHLPKGLFLAVSRGDLLQLLMAQDRIANKAEDIAGLVLGRRLVVPDVMKASYGIFLKRCVDAARQANKAISELDELMQTGFRGNEVKLVEEMIVTLDEIEHDTDEMQVSLRSDLFAVEKDLPAVEVMFLYKLLESTGELADRAQTVGGQLQLLMAS